MQYLKYALPNALEICITKVVLKIGTLPEHEQRECLRHPDGRGCNMMGNEETGPAVVL